MGIGTDGHMAGISPGKLGESMSEHPRRTIALVLLVLLILIISGVGAFFLGSQKNDSPKTESIVLGMLPNEVDTLVYIALDQGFFASNNLNLKVRNYPSGLAAVNGMLNNEVDIATAADFVLTGKAMEGKNVTAIATIDKYSIACLMVRSDLGVSNVSDLKGKRIAVPIGTVAEFNLGRFLELNSIGLDQVTLVNVPLNQAPEALANGSVEAVITSQPYVDIITNLMPDKVLSWPAQRGGSTNYLAVTDDDWANTHPEIVKRFLTALDQAGSLVVHDPGLSRTILQRGLNYTSNYTEKIWSDHQFSLSLDQSLILTLEDQARWMRTNGLTSEPVPNFLSYIYLDGLQAVDPGSVDIIR